MTTAARRIDNWRFWWTVFGFILVGVIVWLFVISRKQGHDEAVRAASTAANNATQVAACFAGVKNAPVVAGFLAGQYALIDNQVLTTKAAIKVSPGDPLNKIRRASLKRLAVARFGLDALSELVAGSTPTISSCKQLASKLGVPETAYKDFQEHKKRKG